MKYYDDVSGQLTQILVGKSITAADFEEGTLTLSDGTQLKFDKDNYDCCSSVHLTSLTPTGNIITAVSVEDDENDPDQPARYGEYKAWIKVVTEAGELNIATADGDASNGYYLHGFALDIAWTGSPSGT